jgi:hypothetical protein
MSAAFKDSSRKNYITTEAFNNAIYSYAVTVNSVSYQVTGSLTVLAAATSSNCPEGRLLRETGKKLYAGANPGITTTMVSVFDEVSGLTGFIDPNSPLFSVYSGDKSVYDTDGVDPATSLLDFGPPVYTRGDLIAQGFERLTGNLDILIGNETISTGSLTVKQSISSLSGNVVAGAGVVQAHGDVITTNGNVVVSGAGHTLRLPTTSLGFTYMGDGSQSGGYRRKTVASSAYTSNSFVFLTNRDQNSVGGAYSAEYISAGNFMIVSNNSNDASYISWMVVNN